MRASAGVCRTRAHSCWDAVDYDEKALIVYYEVEATVMDQYEQPMKVERKVHTKKCA